MEFEHLDYLKFDGCKFKGDHWIDMSNTTVGTVYFSNYRKFISTHKYTENLQNVININIYRIATDNRRYYTIIEDNITQISEELFSMLNSKLSDNQRVVINMHTMSIKKLVLKLNDHSKEIIVSFPKYH